MKKTRFTAVFLCVTTLFSLFAGGVYAEEGVTYIDETTLVIEDGKVVSGDKSLVDKGIVVIGDSSESPEEAPVFIDDECKPDLITSPYGSAGEKAETDLITPPSVSAEEEAEDTFGSPLLSGKAPVKDNSDLLNPDSSTGDKNTQSGVSLPTETPTYIKPTFNFGTANRAMGDTLYYTGAATWNPAIYDLMIMHYTKQVTGTIHVNIAHMARAIAGDSVSTPSSDNKYVKAFKGEFFRINNGANITIENTINNRDGGATLDGLRVYYNTYDLNEDGSNSAGSTFLNHLNIWGNWSYTNWESSSPAWFDPIIIQDGGVSTFNETTFQNGLADENGAAFQLNGGTFNMTDGAFKHCKAKTNGGALYVGGGEAVLTGVTFDNCTAGTNGGAVYMTGGTLTMTGCTITNCSAINGGAICVTGSATIKLINTTVSQNKTISANGSGGALWIGSGAKASIEGTSKINSNLAYNHGGAIRVKNGGELTVSGSTEIKNNDFNQYVVPDSINLSTGAKYKGVGSLYTGLSYSETGTWTEYHAGGRLVDGNATHYKSTLVVFGYNSTEVYVIFDYSAKPITLTGLKLYLFSADGISGDQTSLSSAKYPSSIEVYLSDSQNYSSVSSGDKIGNCTANNSTETKLGVDGGNSYFLNRKEYTLNTTSDKSGKYLILKFNKTQTSRVQCSEIEIKGYYTPEPASETTYGGGIYNEGTTTISGGTIDTNKATYGGGVYAKGGSTFKLNAATIKNCSATSGGAIYLESNSTLHLQNVTVKDNAATGDGAGLFLAGNATVECKNFDGAVVNGGTFDNNDTANGSGAGICAEFGGTIKLNGMTLQNHDSQHGSAILLDSGATLDLTNVNLKNNHATGGSSNNGGAIWVGENVVVNQRGGEISGNTATGLGGGVAIARPGTYNLYSGKISGNSALQGGGVAVYSTAQANFMNYTAPGDPKFNMEGGEISGNWSTSDSAKYGGGLYFRTGDQHTISGGSIWGNTGTLGAGIYMYKVTYNSQNSTITKVTISGSAQIYGNKPEDGVTGYGGGVYVGTTSTLVMNGGTIGGANKATYANKAASGAGVHVVAGSTLTMNGGSILNNEATANGGGVYTNGGTITINGGSVSNNKAEYGAGLYLTGNCVNNIRITGSTAVVNINSNEAIEDGGGIDISNYNGDVTGVVIGGDSGNAVNISQNIAKRGGGIRFRSNGNYSMSATIGDTVTMHKNQATHSAAVYGGGGIFVGDSTTLTVGAATLSENTGYCGGGIFVVGASATVTLNGTTLKDNVAVYSGGGLHTEAFKAITIENVTVDGNSAGDATHDGFGGGLSFYRGAAANTLTIKSGTITGNTSTDSGGGIFFSNDPDGATTLDVDLPKTASTAADPILVISGNDAKIGGGICVDDGSTAHALVTVRLHDGVDIHDNVATLSGGGIYVSPSGVVNMDGGKIRNNDADGGPDVLTKPAEDQVVCGGGVYVFRGTFNVTGGEISGNEAKSIDIARGLGGGIFVHGKATVSIKGTSAKPVVLSNNTANYRGGGLYITDFNTTTTPTFQMDYVNITGNTATNDRGGGAFMEFKDADGVRNVSITNCLVQNNTSEIFVENDESVQGHGGGLYLSSSRTIPGTFTVTNVDFLDNHATVQGAGLYFTNYAKGVVTDCVFERNESKGDYKGTATGSGGGMAVYGGADVSLTDCTFDGNTATTNGGAIGLQGNTSTVNSQTVFNISKLSLTNVKIGETTANEAKANGGGINQGYLSELTVENCLVTKNISRSWGGGICVYTNYSGVAEANKPTYTAKTSISDTTFTGNTATFRGGGIYLQDAVGINGDKVTVNNVKVNNNSSSEFGGGICVDDAFVALSGNNEINGNTTAEFGGGVIVRAEGNDKAAQIEINLNDAGTTEINGNTSGNCGGGVHVAIVGTSGFHMKGGEICNNTSNNSVGGGVDTQGTLVLTGTNVSGNKAYENSHKSYGGGIGARGQQAQVTLRDCVINDNYAIYGGGVAVTEHASAEITGGTISANTADEAGGLLVYNNSNVEASGITVSGNSTTNGDGGGVLVAVQSSLIMTDSYVINNTASGSFSGETAQVEENTLVGAGGGVAVFENSGFEFYVNNKKGAIYGNTASTAGDDVFANGILTKLVIPAPEAMDTSGSGIEDGKWMEDYMDGDDKYSSGLNGNSAIGARRYLTTPVSVRAYVDSAEATGTGHTGEYINDEDGRFVAITFGVPKYNIGSIKITAPESDVPGQRFVFTLKGTNMLGETIELSVSLASKESVTITNLVSGTYTVEQQDDWSWRYEFTTAKVDDGDDLSTKAVSVTITGGELNELHTVTYTNEKENNKWLSHNSECEKNVALPETQNTVFYMAEAKKKYTL